MCINFKIALIYYASYKYVITLSLIKQYSILMTNA